MGSDVTFAQVKKQCLKNGVLYEDPDFPAVDASLFFSKRPPRPFVWKRPKEIVPNPQLFVGGGSRMDVVQGMLGNCWLLSAMSCLCGNDVYFRKVVPTDQSFTNDYCGAFVFQFWRFGVWREVVVDDRLPTYNGKLVFVHSPERNEFWAALLEKAYAKMCGSYEALKGGQTSEAMEDFTGGICEKYDLSKSNDVFTTMKKAMGKQYFMSCSIEAKPNEIEAKLDNGLIKGHAYSVTGVKSFEVKTIKVDAVRVRNPWGNEREWNGAWSDNSNEWKQLSDTQKRSIGLTYDDDGEFWMSFKDFAANFTSVEIMRIPPPEYTISAFNGSWVNNVSAGGCRNFPDTFYTNPQFRIKITEKEDNGEITIALMQKGRRKLKQLGAMNLTIGIAIYKLEDDYKQYEDNGKLNKDYFLYHKSSARSENFLNGREVTDTFNLPNGEYCILPSTFKNNEEGDFLLRIITKSSNTTSGEESTYEPKQTATTTTTTNMEDKFKAFFDKVAGVDGALDAFELQQVLNAALKSELGGADIEVDTCRSLISSTDRDRSGSVMLEEFKDLWMKIMSWRGTFKEHEKDGTGLDSVELRAALAKLGFKLSTPALSAIALRYRNRQGKISVSSFFSVVSRLKACFESYLSYQGRSFTLDDFITSTIYC